MSSDSDTSEREVTYEPPQLMRLAAPNDGAAFCQDGSGNQLSCEFLGSTANSCANGTDANAGCKSGGGDG